MPTVNGETKINMDISVLPLQSIQIIHEHSNSIRIKVNSTIIIIEIMPVLVCSL